VAEVTCNYCQATGEVDLLEVVGKKIRVDDQIDHLETCQLALSRMPKRARQPRHLRKRNWQQQERKAAARVGGQLTPASGALNEDGDLRAFHQLRVECKRTETGVFRLNQRVWSKLVKGARGAGEIPILEVELAAPHGTWRIYVVPEGDLPFTPITPITQARSSARLSLRRGVEADCPFSVSILDPTPVVVTHPQLKRVLNRVFPD
jgi:hypothetical protein